MTDEEILESWITFRDMARKDHFSFEYMDTEEYIELAMKQCKAWIEDMERVNKKNEKNNT